MDSDFKDILSKIDSKLDQLVEKINQVNLKTANFEPRLIEVENKTKMQWTDIEQSKKDINNLAQLIREVRTAGLIIAAIITLGTPFVTKWIG